MQATQYKSSCSTESGEANHTYLHKKGMPNKQSARVRSVTTMFLPIPSIIGNPAMIQGRENLSQLPNRGNLRYKINPSLHLLLLDTDQFISYQTSLSDFLPRPSILMTIFAIPGGSQK